MIGYGSEDQHFVLELTYNYGINDYELGNDLNGITIESNRVLKNLETNKYESQTLDGVLSLKSPDGYRFFIKESSDDRITRVSLASSSLKQSIDYWNRLLSLDVYDTTAKTATLGYDPNQCKLELVDIGGEVRHEKAFGRIAFSCPEQQLSPLEEQLKKEKQKILTPLVSLETPGKATVQVVILADPDGHEICFVGDTAFRQLSQIDPKANEALNHVS